MAFILNNLVFKVAADNYETQVSTVEFVPSTSVVTWQGGTPESSFSATTSAKWTCNLSYSQDWTDPDSLSMYLYEHEGESVEVTFEPIAGGVGFSATVVVVPGSIGGAVDAVQVATVSLGVSGKPVIVPDVTP